MDTMDVEIVENNIPLLISKADMKEMKMHVNFPNDTAVVGGKKINLGCSSMGHYYIPIAKEKVSVNYCNVVLHASNLAKMSRNEKLKKAIKLHRQLSHATKEKLLQVVKHSKYRLKVNRIFFSMKSKISSSFSVIEK